MRYLFPFKRKEFINWYSELGKLKIFWAKPVKGAEWINDKEKRLLRIVWRIRNKEQAGVILFLKEWDKKSFNTFLNEFRGNVRIVWTLDNIPDEYVHAKSYVWFWKVENMPLRIGNRYVYIKLYPTWTDNDLEAFRTVHKESWGFFIPPREGEHMVITANFDEKPVGMAYVNLRNFNIDYGVHVIKSEWRKGIGTRILAECFKMAEENDKEILTCVRVLRSIKGTSADKRAVRFYESIGNPLRINVVKIKESL